jgi:hypothetical protein
MDWPPSFQAIANPPLARIAAYATAPAALAIFAAILRASSSVSLVEMWAASGNDRMIVVLS